MKTQIFKLLIILCPFAMYGQANTQIDSLFRNSYTVFELQRLPNGMYRDAKLFSGTDYHPISVSNTGDLPPRKECAPLWHDVLFEHLQEVELILLIGKYAQDYYLKVHSKKTLTETVKNYKDFLPKYFVLPHPSPRNNIWQAKNEWFARLVVPELRKEIKRLLL